MVASGARWRSLRPRCRECWPATVCRGGSLSHKADLNHAAGRQLLEKWLPHARDPEAVRDVRHRWACACGALALTSGDSEALRRHLADLPPLKPNDDFDVGVAGGIDWAYLLAHGAQGQTWARQRRTVASRDRRVAGGWPAGVACRRDHGPPDTHHARPPRAPGRSQAVSSADGEG